MPDVLIRGLSAAAIARFDAEAQHLGLSRAEVLRRHLEADVVGDEPRPPMTDHDWKRFAEAFADLADPDVVRSAWQ